MNQSRLEWKVGVFVVVSLLALAVLLVSFSKNTGLFSPTYEILMESRNVGGIIPGAKVKMAGVTIGDVRSVDLPQDSEHVVLRLEILSQYAIHKGAKFRIESAGFLGDQYIFISRGDTAAEELQDGAVVQGEEPFNLEQTARSAASLLETFDETASLLKKAAERLDQSLLSEAALQDLTNAVGNLRTASDRAVGILERIERLVETNSPGIQQSVTNAAAFSQRMNEVAKEFQLTLASNKTVFAETMSNFSKASEHARDLLAGLQEGKGLAGSLFKEGSMERDFTQTLSNLNTLISNLNAHGLFYKPRRSLSNAYSLPDYMYPGKRSFFPDQ